MAGPIQILLMVGCVLLASCLPGNTCRYTRTCASRTQHADGSITDAYATEGGRASPDNEPIDAIVDSTAHASRSNAADGSSAETPCTSDTCPVDADVRGPCDADTNPCSGDTPVCVGVDGQPTCVQCVTTDDCAGHPEGPMCVDSVCQVCNPTSHDGCTPDAPWCVAADGATPYCATCTLDEHCVQAGLGNVCLADECFTCDPTTHRGCTAEAPYCVERDVLGDVETSATDATPAIAVAGATGAAGRSANVPSATTLSAECIECRTVSECGSRGIACLNGACVQCTSNEHCTDPTAAVCDLSRNECTGCTAIGECSHLAATPACNIPQGTCVECTREEAAACADDEGPLLCVTVPTAAQFTCSDQRVGWVGACYDCVSDAHCGGDYECVAEQFNGVATGQFVCLKQTTDQTGCPIPFMDVINATSEGGTEGLFCALDFTTCWAYHTVRRSCETDSDCGLPNLDDGFCVPNGPGKKCTIECATDLDCKLDTSCTLTVSSDAGEEITLCADV